MIIAKKYDRLINSIDEYTDERYLELNILMLKNGLYREIAAIKNNKREYIAFTNSYATTFHLNRTHLGISDQNSSMDIFSLTLAQQEQTVINNKKALDKVLVISGVNRKSATYYVKRKPLINPSTQEIIGMLIIATPLDLARLRRIFLKTQNFDQILEQSVDNHNFSKSQNFVIICLLLGFHKRKEIATLIQKLFRKEISDSLVRNTLQTLYSKYDCNSTIDLINLINIDEKLVNNTPLPDPSAVII